MLGFGAQQQYFIYQGSTDMRKGYYGLSGLVRGCYEVFNKQNTPAIAHKLSAFGVAVERHSAGGHPTEKTIQNGGRRLIFDPFPTFIG